jgi:hypothetical protein
VVAASVEEGLGEVEVEVVPMEDAEL